MTVRGEWRSVRGPTESKRGREHTLDDGGRRATPRRRGRMGVWASAARMLRARRRSFSFRGDQALLPCNQVYFPLWADPEQYISKTSSVLNGLIALFCLIFPFISLFSRLCLEISKVKMNKMRNLWEKTEKKKSKLFQDHFQDWWRFPDVGSHRESCEKHACKSTCSASVLRKYNSEALKQPSCWTASSPPWA